MVGRYKDIKGIDRCVLFIARINKAKVRDLVRSLELKNIESEKVREYVKELKRNYGVFEGQ